MVIEKQLYSVEDVWTLVQDPDNLNRRYELIEGELIEMSPPGRIHGQLAADIARYLGNHIVARGLGICTVETGYHPQNNRRTLLSPDVAFLSHARIPDSPAEKYVSVMPDLAVEVLSPSNSLRFARRKAAIYLQNGTGLVWIVQPAPPGVYICRLVASRLQSDFVGSGDVLSGESVLPGFELEIDLLFPSTQG